MHEINKIRSRCFDFDIHCSPSQRIYNNKKRLKYEIMYWLYCFSNLLRSNQMGLMAMKKLEYVNIVIQTVIF